MDFKHHEKIRSYISDAVVGSLGGHKVKAMEDSDHEALVAKFDDIIFTSMLSFDHSLIRGSVMVCCEAEVLAATCPGFNPEREKAAQSRLEDWLGELTNLIVGRFKNHMLNHDVRIQIRPPSVSMSPASILANYSERMPSQAFWFEVDSLKLCIQFSAEISEDLDFYTILDRNATVPRPGDVVMTLNEVDRNRGGDLGGKTIMMNPPVKSQPAPKPVAGSAPRPRPAAPAQSAGGVGDFNGLTWLDDSRVALRFHSGAEIRVDMHRIAGGSRTLSIGGMEVAIAQQAQGFSFTIDGISIFLPVKAA